MFCFVSIMLKQSAFQ